MNGITIRRKVSFARERGKAKRLSSGHHRPRAEAPGRIPRVSRLMALAIRIDELVRERVIRDYADAARLGNVTRARMSQILNLLNLAPDIIEAVLFLPRIERGRDPISEHALRPIAAEAQWKKQRAMWRALIERVDTERRQ